MIHIFLYEKWLKFSKTLKDISKLDFFLEFTVKSK